MWKEIHISLIDEIHSNASENIYGKRQRPYSDLGIYTWKYMVKPVETANWKTGWMSYHW